MLGRLLIYSVIILKPFCTVAQVCHQRIMIRVMDQSSIAPIEDAHISIGSEQYTTDSSGSILIENICPGKYHIDIRHVDCEKKHLYLVLGQDQDTSIRVFLSHHHERLSEAEVSADRIQNSTENTNSISDITISKNAEKNLATLISSIAGVSTIRTGSGIAKPVIEAMYGNRLTILNNGVPQSGQRWGNDHSPEIDPLAANVIQVVKGVSALEYPGNNLGAVVIVEPSKIYRDPKLHGKLNSFYRTNGNLFGVHVEAGFFRNKTGWKFNFTTKKGGDQHAPKYFLTNTGSQELNFGLQLEHDFSDKWHGDLYFSSFNGNIGILRGAEVGNLSDLQSAFTRDVPFFTRSDFSYDLQAPMQKVGHHLLKLHSTYIPSTKSVWDFTFSAQSDEREEFDIRRGGRTDIPSLFLRLLSIYSEAKYKHEIDKRNFYKAGLQYTIADNTNIPETGILPLIPDYRSFLPTAYLLYYHLGDKVKYDLGLRYEYLYQNVAAIDATFPHDIQRYNNRFQNISLMAGISKKYGEHLELGLNLGYKTRNPEVNELYSAGLHQGVSGIEYGDPNLSVEKAFKINGNVEYKKDDIFHLQTHIFYQNISDYIYLQPTGQYQLTIRGAYPVFDFNQTDAVIYGINGDLHWGIYKSLHLDVGGAWYRGDDKIQNQPLVYIPSSNITSSLNYAFHISEKWMDLQISIQNQIVFEQTHLLASQDFLPPPPTYSLWGFELSSGCRVWGAQAEFHLRGENIMNTSYRDYMNRLRYFSDDVGRSWVLGFSLYY